MGDVPVLIKIFKLLIDELKRLSEGSGDDHLDMWIERRRNRRPSYEEYGEEDDQFLKELNLDPNFPNSLKDSVTKLLQNFTTAENLLSMLSIWMNTR